MLHLLSLGCAFHLANRLFRKSAERNFLAYSLAAVGVALSLFAVYQKARFGTVLYGWVPVESGTPFGPFVNHNHFAGYVEAAALVALGASIGLSRRASALAAIRRDTVVWFVTLIQSCHARLNAAPPDTLTRESSRAIASISVSAADN
ncbi:MAG: hypothetical protein ACRD1Z_01920, partial [Vicinamibacteria bacterium]